MDEVALGDWIGRTKAVVLKAASVHLDPAVGHLLDDVVQEVYLRAWKARAKFEGRSAETTWLYAIARNEARRVNQRAWRENRRQERAAEDLELRGDAPSAEMELMNGIPDVPAWKAAAAGIPSPYGGLLLEIAAGAGVAELAERYGIPEGTVKSRLFRARELLARKMAERIQEEPEDLAGRRLTAAGGGR